VNGWVIGTLLLVLALGISGAAIEVGLTVSHLRTTLQAGEQHVSAAEALATQLSASPLDHTLLTNLRHEVAAAEQDFRQAQADLTPLAPGGVIPGLGTKVADAQALLVMAVALSGGGRTLLDAAMPVLDGIRSPLAPAPTATPTPTPHSTATPTPTAPPAPQLTVAQLTTLSQAVQTFTGDLATAAAARSRIHDNGASLDQSLPHLLARYDAAVPTLQHLVDDAGALTAAAPVLLGVTHPASYLVEILDETELRGGGGFIGNYGLISVTGGRVVSTSVRDSYLLDDAYLASHSRAFPPNYSWFRLAPSMGLRDSNLAPDFAYNAQLAERIFSEESGQSVVGVVAFTPAFIARLLTITGPVLVPGYNVTVNSQNLVSTIHYYQFLTGDQGVPSSDGISSVRKHFTAVLGDAVFARVRSLPPSDLHRLLSLASDGLKSKDLQVYLDDAGAEAVLMREHLANTLVSAPPPAPGASATTPTEPGDTLAFVDNNIGVNKAYLYVTQAIADDVTLQANGASRHSLTVRYVYHPTGDVHGQPTFADEVQVFVPTGSTFAGQSGLNAVDPAGQAYGRAVFGGRISLAPNTSRTVTLSWSVPAAPGVAASATPGYRLLVTRQAGSVCTFAIAIHLPSAAANVQPTAPLAVTSGVASYKTSGPLSGDLNLLVHWN
jgi:hypothetical protein